MLQQEVKGFDFIKRKEAKILQDAAYKYPTAQNRKEQDVLSKETGLIYDL